MDFPAAHSMDTQWYAVDRDGNVAVFDTGEGGGVPELAVLDEGQHFDLAEQVRELPGGGAMLDRDGHARGLGQAHCEPRPSGREIIAFVDELEPVQDLVASLAATVEPAKPGHMLRFTVGDRAELAESFASVESPETRESLEWPAKKPWSKFW